MMLQMPNERTDNSRDTQAPRATEHLEIMLEILGVWQSTGDTLFSFQCSCKPSHLPHSPPPLCSQVVLSFMFQELEHLLNCQIIVCLSGFLVERIETLPLRSHSFCFQTLVRPVFSTQALVCYEHQGSFAKEVFQPKPNIK